MREPISGPSAAAISAPEPRRSATPRETSGRARARTVPPMNASTARLALAPAPRRRRARSCHSSSGSNTSDDVRRISCAGVSAAGPWPTLTPVARQPQSWPTQVDRTVHALELADERSCGTRRSRAATPSGIGPPNPVVADEGRRALPIASSSATEGPSRGTRSRVAPHPCRQSGRRCRSARERPHGEPEHEVALTRRARTRSPLCVSVEQVHEREVIGPRSCVDQHTCYATSM